MEVGMSCVRAMRIHHPLSNNFTKTTHQDVAFLRRGVGCNKQQQQKKKWQQQLLVVEAKGKKGGGMQSRLNRRPPPPPALPKLEDDGNPKFVIFIRPSKVNLWYPLSLITGGTTAKIMVAAKDNFLGKYIYKDTVARNLAAVIYRDEKELQKTALKQHRVLRSATSFRYGFKLVENLNLRSALSTSNVIELPPQEELTTVLDKVKNFFDETASSAKESFGKLTSLTSVESEESEPQSEGKT